MEYIYMCLTGASVDYHIIMDLDDTYWIKTEKKKKISRLVRMFPNYRVCINV